MFKKKSAKFILFALICFTYSTRFSFALEDARIVTEVDSVYSVTSENTGTANISVSFTNEGEISTILSKYNLNIGNVDPSNIEITYQGEDVPYTMYESEGIVLQMSLGDILLRPDEPETVSIEYTLSVFFSEVGGAHDVTLPMYDTSSKSNGGSLSITYPNSFGSINYSNIEYDKETEKTRSKYSFESDEISSLFISVGSSRNFSLNMERKLENTTSDYITQQLLIPIDTSTQTLVISNISPFPDSVNLTDEGNLFLVYNISPNDTIWVRFQALITTKILEDHDGQLSSIQKAVHLDRSLALWKITDEELLATVNNLEFETIDEKVNWIYDYAMENLNLSDDFRELHSFEYRKGAEIALQTYKNSSSEDFADVFVALARLMDIPSRVVSGYVFPYAQTTNRVGIYHVWPQYWSDQNEWVSMDPAYELYSGFDQKDGTGLNRVTMAVYPSSLSELDFDETSNEIFFTEEDVEEIVDLDIEIEIDDQIQAGKIQTGGLSLHNNGNTIIRDITFSDIDGDLKIEFDQNSDRTVLLPGESFDYDFSTRISEWYLSGNKRLKVEVLSKTAEGEKRNSAEKTVGVTPLRWAEPVTWILTTILFVISTGILYFVYKLVIKVSSKYKSITK